MFVRSLRDHLPYREADSGTGEGGNADTPDNDANTGGEQGGTGETQQQPFITFPDEKSFMARVRREGKNQLTDMAKELGFDSVDAMKATLTAARQQAESEKTDLQKAQDAATAAKAELEATVARANDRLLRAEVKSVSADLGIVDSDAAYALMARDDVAVDDDGNVTGVKAALEALLKAKPYLKKQEAATASGGEFNGSDTKSGESMNALLRKAAGRA